LFLYEVLLVKASQINLLNMKEINSINRRLLVKSSVFGMLAVALPHVVFAKNVTGLIEEHNTNTQLPHERYPAIRLEIAAEVVGVSHFNLDRLKELVEPRPELAKAIWDWGYGDWESAIGAASHAGRKEIVAYLVSKGAVPTIFTFAMLGELNAVKAMIESYPGIQKNFGPHEISLLQHARTGMQTEGADQAKYGKLIDYLQSLGDADGRTYLQMEQTAKEKFIGDYKFGVGKDEGFTVKLNMKKNLSLGKPGKSGGSLLQTGENEFVYNAAPSVRINFQVREGRVISMTVKEPDLLLTATRI
jgi:hypothetical protein